MATGQETVTPVVRVGDTERERVRQVLSRHAEDGRITLEEYGDRLSEVYAARTAPELQAALRELPPLAPGAVPAPPAERAAARRRTWAGLAAYAGFVALMLTIWALTGAGFFWPLWPIVGVGFGLARSARADSDQAGEGSARHARGFTACAGPRGSAQGR